LSRRLGILKDRAGSRFSIGFPPDSFLFKLVVRSNGPQN
jgi:hypothetical protein